MDTSAFLKQIDKLPGYQGQVIHVERLPARRARYGMLDRPLPSALDAALQGIGAARLNAHQAEAINAVRSGQHLILSTGTAAARRWLTTSPSWRRSWPTAGPEPCTSFLPRLWPRISCGAWVN